MNFVLKLLKRFQEEDLLLNLSQWQVSTCITIKQRGANKYILLVSPN